MSVLVEIYDVRELDINLEYEPNGESLDIISEMNLTGQLQLVNKEGDRTPYAQLTEDQLTVAVHLFPKFSLLQDYKHGPIPYRVLKEAKFAREHFEYLYILHDTPAEVKDPILVGSHSQFYTWRESARPDYQSSFLIARWGDALEDWSVLLKKALRVKKDKGIAKFLNLMSYLEGAKKGVQEGYIEIVEEMKTEDVLNMILRRG